MTPKLFYGLTIAAAVSAAVAGVTYYSGQTWSPGTVSGAQLLPGLSANAERIETISVQQGEDAITVARKGDDWVITDRGDFPANIDEVRKTIVGLTQMTVIEEKTRNDARYKLLHLEDPSAKDTQSKLVTLKAQDGSKIAEVVLGKIKFGVLGPGRNGTYVRIPGDPQTWLAAGNVDAPSEVRGWAQKTIYKLPKETVAQVQISHPDKETVVLTRKEDSADNDFDLANLPEGAKLKQDADLGFIAAAVAELELTDVDSAEKYSADLQKTVYAEIITTDKLSLFVTVLFSEGEDHWVSVKASGPENVKEMVDAINALADGRAFKVQTYKAENLQKRLSDLVEEPEDKSDS